MASQFTIHPLQRSLFPSVIDDDHNESLPFDISSTFAKNMALPVHSWFRYSAGFSAKWVESTIRRFGEKRRHAPRIFDPFAGSATTLLAAEAAGVESCGVEAHPFVFRIAMAKLSWRSDPDSFLNLISRIRDCANRLHADVAWYPELIRRCYDDATLAELDVLRRAYELERDDTEASQLAWLVLISILRKVSKVGTAQWQYVLPKKQKRKALPVMQTFDKTVMTFHTDMRQGRAIKGPRPKFWQADARNCNEVPSGFADLIVTSPPYPNNYDYADATRLEMSFMGEVKGWGDLQDTVRKHLIRSCSQHVPESAGNLDEILSAPELSPIYSELAPRCKELAAIRMEKGGRKTYHLMAASYFFDLALVWKALRRVCRSNSKVCFVIGDSAPYGIYLNVIPWLGELALAAGFKSFSFEKTRDRNIKWKNRKHRVPLQEGHLWVEG